MQELVEIEAVEVSGGGTRLGTAGSGDGNQELTPTQMEQVNGAGGGIRVGSDGANNLAGQAGDGGDATQRPVMGSITPTEMQQVSGGGTRIGTVGTGDGNRNGEVGHIATPILF